MNVTKRKQRNTIILTFLILIAISIASTNADVATLDTFNIQLLTGQSICIAQSTYNFTVEAISDFNATNGQLASTNVGGKMSFTNSLAANVSVYYDDITVYYTRNGESVAVTNGTTLTMAASDEIVFLLAEYGGPTAPPDQDLVIVPLSTDELLGLVVVFFVIGLACSIALVVALRKK